MSIKNSLIPRLVNPYQATVTIIKTIQFICSKICIFLKTDGVFLSKTRSQKAPNIKFYFQLTLISYLKIVVTISHSDGIFLSMSLLKRTCM